MKKILFSMAMVVLSTLSLTAQVTEGSVKYSIDMSSTNPELEMQLAMMQGSTFELFFQEDVTRSEMNMGTIMKIVTITNAKSEDGVMLMSGMMGNTAVKMNPEDMNEAKEDVSETEVTFTDETKEIQGFKCKKAVVTDEEGTESIILYSEEITVNTL